MPFVKIEILKGHDQVYKKTLLESVHQALVHALHIDDDDKYQRLYELDEDCFERGSTKTNQFTMIEITMFQGRTMYQKKQVYEEIVKELQKALNIVPTDVFIVISDPKDENWGLGGIQRAACPCKRVKCERHGDCQACREHHQNIKGKPTACERLEEK